MGEAAVNMSSELRIMLIGVLSISLTAAVPTSMLAAQGTGVGCTKPGYSCVIERHIPIPSPGSTQLLVRMHSSSANPADADQVEPGCSTGYFPCSNNTLGVDGAGLVVSVGARCQGFNPGDEVWGFFAGAYAQYAVAECESTEGSPNVNTVIGAKPANLGLQDAGTIPIVGGTAFSMLRAAGFPYSQPNLTVVITAGQGGTGFMAIQLSKALGASTVITAATGDGIAFVKQLGADHVVDFHETSIPATLPANSVDIVIDNLGIPGTADRIMPAIRSGGTYLVLPGQNRGTISKHPKAGVRQVNFGAYKESRADLNELKSLFEEGKLQPRTMQPVYQLNQIAEAF